MVSEKTILSEIPFFSINTPREDYGDLLRAAPGTIFRVAEDDYETVLERIMEYFPDDEIFKTCPITPGTPWFATLGPNHVVIIENTNQSVHWLWTAEDGALLWPDGTYVKLP